MEISINTPALLFPAIAILTLGYVNRYLGIAGVIRNFKKDYDSGYIHNDIVVQLDILKKRVQLARNMIGIAIGALMLACLSMFFIFIEWSAAGVVIFGASVLAMILSMLFSLYETTLSNRSLFIELHDILEKESQKK
ncbi:MAG: DUF2721 domain-containing protein [Candidatus Saccharimonadales bacterium]